MKSEKNENKMASGNCDGIVLITGPQGSGKSAFAEAHLMSRFCAPLYIGTLPKSKRFQVRIDKHVERRCERWSLIEFTGQETHDRHAFEHMSKYYDSILLDGISSHFWLKHLSSKDSPECLMRYVHRMIGMLSESSKPVFLVDCDSPFPNGGSNAWFNKLMHEVHEEVSTLAKTRVVFK